MRNRKWAATPILLLLPCCAGAESTSQGGQSSCPAIGCPDAVRMKISTQLSRDEMTNATYTACRGDECFVGPFQMLQRAGSEPEQALTPEAHEEK